MVGLIAILPVGCTVDGNSPQPVVLDDTEVEPGWGPDRALFDEGVTAEGAVLNSASAGLFGDERSMMGVRLADSSGGWATDLTLDAGAVYEGYVIFHNNGDTTATGVRVTVRMSAVVDSRQRVVGLLSADNTDPDEMWRSVVLSAQQSGLAYALRYVPDSAIVWVAGQDGGQPVTGYDLFDDGLLVGCGRLDGTVEPGCAGWVTYRFVADQPNFEIQQTARSGVDAYTGATVHPAPGSTIDVRVGYTNTGTTQMDNVTVRADLPAGFELVEGTTILAYSGYPDGVTISDNIASGGVNIGSYAPDDTNAWVEFTVKVPAAACEYSDATISTSVVTSGGRKSDEQRVVVDRDASLCAG